MSEKFNGDENKFSKEDLKLIKDISSLDINYYSCYSDSKIHPDYAICEKCEKVVPGTDQSLVRQLVHITGQFNLLKSK